MASEWIDRYGISSSWKDRARALHLRIRDRFRVAVDRRRRSPEVSNYSSSIWRWIHRAWTVLRDPSSPAPPSLRFYRKRVDMDVDAFNDSIIVRWLQALAVPVIGNACHFFMHGLNDIQIYGAEKLQQALLQRPQGKPLITVSNHVAAVDDPLVIASLMPPSVMLDARNLRWTLCATDRCFSNPMLSAFFRCVKVLPVSRGDGVYQKGMDMALSKLNNGGWVHIFPEGSRSRDGGQTMNSAKRGVGRLVMDADSIPVVIPFVHTGMEEIMPIGTHFPNIGKRVTVLIGDPLLFDDLIVGKDDYEDDSRGYLYDAISSRIGRRLQELKVQVDRLALEQPFGEAKEYRVRHADDGDEIWKHVDWEAFGMENFMTSDSQPLKHVIPSQAKPSFDQPRKPDSTYRNVRMGFSYEGGIVSRIRGYMNPNELMGFAARGLFINGRILDESHSNSEEATPFKAWRRFLDGRVFGQWNSM